MYNDENKVYNQVNDMCMVFFVFWPLINYTKPTNLHKNHSISKNGKQVHWLSFHFAPNKDWYPSKDSSNTCDGREFCVKEIRKIDPEEILTDLLCQ